MTTPNESVPSDIGVTDRDSRVPTAGPDGQSSQGPLCRPETEPPPPAPFLVGMLVSPLHGDMKNRCEFGVTPKPGA